MAGRMYFSIVLCIITNPFMNSVLVDIYQLKFGWFIGLNTVFVASCIMLFSTIDKIEEQVRKLKSWHEDEIERLELEIDKLKKEKEKT